MRDDWKCRTCQMQDLGNDGPIRRAGKWRTAVYRCWSFYSHVRHVTGAFRRWCRLLTSTRRVVSETVFVTFIAYKDQSFLGPSFFSSCIFHHNEVRHFQVLHFPAFDLFWSVILWSCEFIASRNATHYSWPTVELETWLAYQVRSWLGLRREACSPILTKCAQPITGLVQMSWNK